MHGCHSPSGHIDTQQQIIILKGVVRLNQPSFPLGTKAPIHYLGITTLSILLLLGVVPPTFADFSFEEMEELEQTEQGELLELARQASRNENFSGARDYLSQARHKGYAPDEVGAVEQQIAADVQQYQERQRQLRAAAEQREREAEQQRLAEAAQRAAEQQQASHDASGNMGGSLQCSYVSADYGLWNYCNSGDCSGLSGNYGLWQLCQNNDASGLSSNFGIWNYLTNGDPSGLSSDYNAWKAATRFKGSFADRKRFVIFYLYGHM